MKGVQDAKQEKLADSVREQTTNGKEKSNICDRHSSNFVVLRDRLPPARRGRLDSKEIKSARWSKRDIERDRERVGREGQGRPSERFLF